jgi:hypothetical protein
MLLTIQDMLTHERSALTRTIERMERGIQVDTRAGLRIDGQKLMLDTQMNHLDTIDHLLANADDVHAALDDCRILLMMAEEAHRKAAQHDLLDIMHTHSDSWWNSLHDIEYYSDLIQRIEKWRVEHEK